MDIALFWALFVILGITYFAIAMGASRNLDSDEDFFYGHRKFGVLAMALSLAAIQIGGGMVLGTAEEAYRFGFHGIFYNLGICASFFVLALGLARKLRNANIKTTAELFFTKYRSNVLRRIASLMSILTLGGILIGQITASRKLLDTVVGQYQWILIVFWLLVIVYTMFGGLRAVVATEIFQVTLVVLVFAFMFVIFVWKRPVILEIFHHPLEVFAIDPRFDDPVHHRSWVLFFMPFFYALFAQDLGQRFFASRTASSASFSALFAGIIVLLFSLLPVIFGMEARHLAIEADANQSVMLELLRQNLEPFFYYLSVCAVIAAISSTADALLCAIGSNVVEDFLLSSSTMPVDKYVSILVSRMVILIVGILSLIIAYRVDDIFAVLSVSYEVSISSLLVPILFALFTSNPKYEAAAAAMIMGLVGFIGFRLYPIPFIPKELASIALSLLGFLVGYVYGKKKLVSPRP